MSLMIAIAEFSLVALGALLFAAQIGAHEFGYWLGRRKFEAGGTQPEGVGVIVGGMLALAGFVLALTLSFANSRFLELREGSLAETNAIGTAWLRAAAIGGPRGEAVAKLLEQYAATRQAFVAAGNGATVLDELTQTTQRIQGEIWGQVAGLVRERPDAVVSSLMVAVNDTFDASTEQRFAFGFRLPQQVFWLLIAMTVLGMGTIGYQIGLRNRSLRVLAAIFALMWTVVIIDIIDLATARLGSFRPGIAVYEWTQQGFAGGVTVQPAGSAP